MSAPERSAKNNVAAPKQVQCRGIKAVAALTFRRAIAPQSHKCRRNRRDEQNCALVAARVEEVCHSVARVEEEWTNRSDSARHFRRVARSTPTFTSTTRDRRQCSETAIRFSSMNSPILQAGAARQPGTSLAWRKRQEEIRCTSRNVRCRAAPSCAAWAPRWRCRCSTRWCRRSPTAANTAAAHARFGFMYIPHGVILDQFLPTTEGADFEYRPIMKPIEAFRNQTTLVSNLVGPPDGGSGHVGAGAAWLTGASAKTNRGRGCAPGHERRPAHRAGSSRRDTAVPVARAHHRRSVRASSAHATTASAAPTSTPSRWSTPTTPLPMEINPRVVFERMFGDAKSKEHRLANMRADRSILDSIREDEARLKGGLGSRATARASPTTSTTSGRSSGAFRPPRRRPPRRRSRPRRRSACRSSTTIMWR